jgi:hypothetical protein
MGRFYSEIQEGVQLGDKIKQLSSHKHANKLPKGCYDTIDGKELALFSSHFLTEG